MAAIAGLDHLMKAEEAAHRRNVAEAGLPQGGDDESERGQRKEARRTVTLEQHEGRECHQRDLERQLCGFG
jgi:hypothetical protein